MNGKQIATIREASGYSMRELSQKTGLHYNTLYRIENNINSPSVSQVEKILEPLGYELVIQKKGLTN